MQCMQILKNQITNVHARIFSNKFGKSLAYSYLCSDDRVYPTATSAAMAEERLCLCTDILQQQPVEASLLLAHVGGVCLVLSGFEQHLLLQRSEGCRGRPSASEEMSSPDCIWESLCQWWLRDDGT